MTNNEERGLEEFNTYRTHQSLEKQWKAAKFDQMIKEQVAQREDLKDQI